MERIISNINQIAKKWEFVYRNEYHKDKVQYPVKEGTPYVICYGTDKKEMYLDGKNNILIRLKNHTLFHKYSKAKGSLKREVYLKPHKIIMTQKIRNRGSVGRYFAKYKLSEFYDKVFEINKQSFKKETLLYDKVPVSWQLEGTKEEILKKNIESLEKAEEIMWGIRDSLDPLKFYEEEVNPEEVLQRRLSKLKFIPGGSEVPLEKKVKKKRQKGSKRGRTNRTRSGYHKRTQQYTNQG
jgi:hypothetical protein